MLTFHAFDMKKFTKLSLDEQEFKQDETWAMEFLLSSSPNSVNE